jgi:hypothetical protein
MNYNKNQKKLVEEFFNKIKIIDSGHKLVRIGKNGDGGYLIPNILNQVDYCFSPGVGMGDSSTFEDSLANYNICSFLADGTVDYVGKHNFIKKNLNCYNDKNNITLESWVSQKIQDHTNNKLILQMDIDGAEIEVLYEIKISLCVC